MHIIPINPLENLLCCKYNDEEIDRWIILHGDKGTSLLYNLIDISVDYYSNMVKFTCTVRHDSFNVILHVPKCVLILINVLKLECNTAFPQVYIIEICIEYLINNQNSILLLYQKGVENIMNPPLTLFLSFLWACIWEGYLAAGRAADRSKTVRKAHVADQIQKVGTTKCRKQSKTLYKVEVRAKEFRSLLEEIWG